MAGTAEPPTLTVALWLMVPSGPVHANEYVVVVVKDWVASGVVLTVLTAVPVPNCPPDKEHEVLLVDDQLRVVLAPLAIEVGIAVRVTVGPIAMGVGREPPLLSIGVGAGMTVVPVVVVVV